MEMKLEEITVTSQPKSPKKPLVVITENAHVIIGKNIQRNCQKINHNVSIKKQKLQYQKPEDHF